MRISKAAIVALAVFLFRLLLLVILPAGPFRHELPVEGDELNYLALAHQLTDSGFQSYQVEGDSADQRRVPVYPLELAVVSLVAKGGSLRAAMTVVNLLLHSLALFLILQFCENNAAPRWAWLAFALSAIDLVTAVQSARLLTEATYSILLIIAITSGLRTVRGGDGRWMIVSGVALGLAVLTRPIAMFIPFLAGAWLLTRTTPNRWKPSAVLVLSAMVVIVPWCARNLLVHSKFFVSEISLVGLYRYRAPSVVSRAENRPFLEVQKEFDESFKKDLGANITVAVARQEYMRSRAVPILLGDPLSVMLDVPKGVVTILRGRATEDLYLMAGTKPFGLGAQLRSFPLSPLTWASVLEFLALPLTWLLAIRGVWLMRKSDPMLAAVLVATVLYHIVLPAGPEADSRFRIPIMPLVVCMACAALPRPKTSEPDHS